MHQHMNIIVTLCNFGPALKRNVPSYVYLHKRAKCNLVSQEVRVRFSGFGKEEDEWVNVRTGVRERSIPLEPSECEKVKVGDLVLCFQVISLI